MATFTLPKAVLVADDDDDIRTIVSSAVSLLGCTPILAVDGADAVGRCQETTPDAVVLDLMMPGLSGLEVCEKIRAMPGGELIPILILTARDSVQDKVTALEEGADDYLTKPFHFQELQARIKALLRVRELNVTLSLKNKELQDLQAKLVEKERQLAVEQTIGSAAHNLGQPLSAIILNCHLLETVKPDDVKFGKALKTLKVDAKRMAEMIEQLKTIDARKTASYGEGITIFDIDDR